MLHSKARTFFSVMVALIMVVTALLSAAPVFAKADGTTEYVVKAGENLTDIAKKFGLTVEKIMAVNPAIKDPNTLLAGQKIILPAGRSEGVVPVKQGRYYRWQLEKDGNTISKDEHFYLVKNGDTLEKIAKAYGVSMENLLAVNPQIDDPNQLFRQELVRIPDGRAENVPPFYSTPPSGDSK